MFGDIHGPKPYEFIGFGDIHGPKPYEFIGFGDIHGPKPYEFIGFGDVHGPKPYEFIGFGDIPSGSGAKGGVDRMHVITISRAGVRGRTYPGLYNSASGPEIGIPGRMSAGSGKPQNRQKAVRSADFEAFPIDISAEILPGRPISSSEALLRMIG
jgi:hypothetical protein